MSERIERWANVYGELDGKEYIDGFYLTRDQARNNAAFGYLRQAHLVEIRDGEPHPDETANVIAALTERAERAEVTVRARDAEIKVLRAFLKQFEDGGLSGREVREAKADERDRYRREVMRESYQRALTQMHWSANDLTESGLTYAQWSARQARDEAAVLTDAAFRFVGAKEAKGDE